jgi:hypothetical protein
MADRCEAYAVASAAVSELGAVRRMRKPSVLLSPRRGYMGTAGDDVVALGAA